MLFHDLALPTGPQNRRDRLAQSRLLTEEALIQIQSEETMGSEPNIRSQSVEQIPGLGQGCRL